MSTPVKRTVECKRVLYYLSISLKQAYVKGGVHRSWE